MSQYIKRSAELLAIFLPIATSKCSYSCTVGVNARNCAICPSVKTDEQVLFLSGNKVDMRQVHSTRSKTDLNRKDMASDSTELDDVLLHCKQLLCCVLICASCRSLSVNQSKRGMIYTSRQFLSTNHKTACNIRSQPSTPGLTQPWVLRPDFVMPPEGPRIKFSSQHLHLTRQGPNIFFNH
jgi:hypothetical protein